MNSSTKDGFTEAAADYTFAPEDIQFQNKSDKGVLFEFFKKRRLLFYGAIFSALVGLGAAFLVNVPYTTKAKFLAAKDSNFFGLTDILKQLDVPREVLTEFVKSELKRQINNPQTFEILHQSNPNLFSDTGFASGQEFIDENMEIRFIERTIKNTISEPAHFELSFLTKQEEQGPAFYEAFAKTLDNRVSNQVKTKLNNAFAEKQRILEASFKSEKNTRKVQSTIEIELLTDDLELARLAGYESPAPLLDRIQLAEAPLQQVLPRYFFGTKVLAKKLSIMKDESKEDTRLPAYLIKTRFENQLVAYSNIINSENLIFTTAEIIERPSNTLNAIVKSLTAFGSFILIMLLLLTSIAFGYWYKKLKLI